MEMPTLTHMTPLPSSHKKQPLSLIQTLEPLPSYKRQKSAKTRVPVATVAAEEAIGLNFYNWEAALYEQQHKWNQITALHLVADSLSGHNENPLDSRLDSTCWEAFNSLHTVYIDEVAFHKLQKDSKIKFEGIFRYAPRLIRVVFTENSRDESYDQTLVHQARLRIYGEIRKRSSQTVQYIMFSSVGRRDLPMLDGAFVEQFVRLFRPPLKTLCIPVMSFANLLDAYKATIFSQQIPTYDKLQMLTADHVSIGVLKKGDSCKSLISALWQNTNIQTVGIINRHQLFLEAAACHTTNSDVTGDTGQACFSRASKIRKERIAHKTA